jgi:ferredoxin
MHKVIQYRNKCIGCGICQEILPSHWRMSKKDGKATLLNAASKKDISVLTIPDSFINENRAVARACPVKIIKVNI